MMLLLLSTAGCNWLKPIIFMGEHQRKVTAEFDKLSGHKVALLVWTPPETITDFPFARVELSAHIQDKLLEGLASRSQEIDLVDPRDVEDYLQRNFGSVEPRKAGRHFGADYVVYLEVNRFQIRVPDQPQLLRGQIHASVAVYDVRADPDQTMRYELAPVLAEFPEAGPVPISPTNSRNVREQTYRMFAERVARKFFDYTEDL